MSAMFVRRVSALAAVAAAAALTAGCSLVAPPPSSPSPSTTAEATQPTTPPEPPRTLWGPLESQVEQARQAVAGMTVEQKAGQVLVQYYSGVDSSRALQLAEQLHLGGTIIMGDNVPTGAAGVDTEALAQVVGDFREVQEAGRDWPSIVSVDQEGGIVARLRAPLTEWPVPMAFGAAGDPELTERAQSAMAADLARLGFTMNFSPDADVTLGPEDPVIGSRSYSSDPETVAEHALAAVGGSLEAGVLPSLKHFPGHGSVTTDSHVGLPVQEATVEELRERDWAPFLAGAAGEGTIAGDGGGLPTLGAPMVMVGHIAVTDLGPGVPASLSAAAYEALRDADAGIGFEGVAVTDALNMGALAETPGNPAVNALAAGADLLLMPADVAEAHAAIVAAVADGTVSPARLDEAATRVIAMMLWQGELAEDAGLDASVGGGATADASEGAAASATADASEDATASATAPETPDAPHQWPNPESQAVAREAAAAAVTVVDGQCTGPLVGDSIQIIGGRAADRERLAEAARAAGLGVGGGDVVVLLGTGAGPANGDVVVSLDAPWPLEGSSANSALVALFGRTPESFAALVDVLTGAAEAPGRLPVDVGDYSAGSGCAAE